MKKYYTTSKTGEMVEVDSDLAKQLVSSGKKKPEDFQVSEGTELETTEALKGSVMMDRVGKGESLGRGAMQGATMGFGDEISGVSGGAVQTLADKFYGNPEGQGFKKNYQEQRDLQRKSNIVAQESNPWTYGAGEFAGAAPLFAGGGGAKAVSGFIPKSIALSKAAAQLGGMGGAQALGTSDADLMEGEFGEAAADTGKGAALGMALGAVAGPAMGVAKRVVNPAWWGDIAETAGAKALGFTKRLLKTPQMKKKAGETARTMLEEGVISPFATAKEMGERTSTLLRRSGADIGDYLKTRDQGFDTQSAIDAMNKLRPRSSAGAELRGGAYDKANGIIDNAIETLKAHGPVIPFEEANAVKSMLQDMVNWNSTKMEAKLGKHIAGGMRESIDTSLENMAKNPLVREMVEDVTPGAAGEVLAGKVYREAGPEVAEAEFNQFLRNKKVYGAGMTAEDALANRISSEQGNKLFGLTDTILGGTVGAGEMAMGMPPIKGMAMVGGKKAVEKFGMTTAASGAFGAEKGLKTTYDWVNRTLKVDPQKLGKFAQPLMNAARGGAQQVGVTHWVLQNTNPEYRNLIRQESEEQ